MHRTGSTITGMVLLAVAFTVLAPRAIGGANTYVVTRGSSMLPTIRPGDFAVTRAAAGYAVGDVVAFRDPQLRQLVLHRIIGRDGARYVTKGDNNSFVDPYEARPADVVGRLWLHLPAAGHLVTALRNPALSTPAFALLLLSAATAAPPPVPTTAKAAAPCLNASSAPTGPPRWPGRRCCSPWSARSCWPWASAGRRRP